MARRGGRARCSYDGKTTFRNWRTGKRTANRLFEGTHLYWCPQAGGWHVTDLPAGEYDRRRSMGLKGELETKIDLRAQPRRDEQDHDATGHCAPCPFCRLGGGFHALQLHAKHRVPRYLVWGPGDVPLWQLESRRRARPRAPTDSPIRHWSILYCQGGGMAPVQYRGEFLNGFKFYFRMRSSLAQLMVGPPEVSLDELPLVNPRFDRATHAKAALEGTFYPHEFFQGPVGRVLVYPDDPLVGWFKEEDDLQRSFASCFEEIKEQIGLGDMVCPKCTQGSHELCKGGTWCDCQHRKSHPGAEPVDDKTKQS